MSENYVIVPLPLTPELLTAFQHGFIAELHQTQKHRTMTAEEAGIRALIKEASKTSTKVDVEDALEQAYWRFDARRKGYSQWSSNPQSERDAFKSELRGLLHDYLSTNNEVRKK